MPIATNKVKQVDCNNRSEALQLKWRHGALTRANGAFVPKILSTMDYI
jgi:hypothetical protein